jgi:hypothetical protein
MTNQEEIALASKHGFQAEPDARRGGGWCKFVKKGDGKEIHVWESRGWVRAEFDGESFVNHAYHPSLEAALTEQV